MAYLRKPDGQKRVTRTTVTVAVSELKKSKQPSKLAMPLLVEPCED